MNYCHISFLTGAAGSGELIVIFLVILVLFGPKRLPEVSKMVGKTLSQLRRGAEDFKDQIMKIDDDEPIDVTNDEYSSVEDHFADDVSDSVKEDHDSVKDESEEEKEEGIKDDAVEG